MKIYSGLNVVWVNIRWMDEWITRNWEKKKISTACAVSIFVYGSV